MGLVDEYMKFRGVENNPRYDFQYESNRINTPKFNLDFFSVNLFAASFLRFSHGKMEVRNIYTHRTFKNECLALQVVFVRRTSKLF